MLRGGVGLGATESDGKANDIASTELISLLCSVIGEDRICVHGSLMLVDEYVACILLTCFDSWACLSFRGWMHAMGAM